jgi:tetratricopeptide (TPR) repeat protein
MTTIRGGWLPALLLVTAVVAAFSPLLSREFHAEDERALARVAQIDGTEGATRAFTHAHYRAPFPVAALFLRAQQELFPARAPAPFLGVSLALHVGNVLLLLWILRRSGAGAWAAALITGAFALHPVQVENVARVAAQGELLAIGAVLLGLLLRERQGLLAEFGLLSCLLAGALCSPTALLLPPMLVLLAQNPNQAFVARTPQLVAGLLLAFLLWSRTVHELALWDALYGTIDHLHHFGAAILLSLADLTGPYALSPLHVVPPPLPRWLPAVALPLVALIFWAGARRTGTGRPAILLGLALVLAATRGLLRFEFRADGWLAFAVIGLAWMLVVRLGRPGRFARLAGLTILGFWAVMAHTQATHWITERALLDHTIAAEPTNWRARTARAEWAMSSGATDLIEPDALAALIAQPRSVAAAFTLASARALAGDEDGAGRLAAHGARTDWNDRNAELRLGYVLLEVGLTSQAVTLLERTSDPEAQPGLALGRARLGNLAMAQAHLDDALVREPVRDEALVALAWLLATAPEAELRDPERALSSADRVQALQFRHQQLDARAAALARLGRFAEAYRDAQAAARQAEADGYLARANDIRTRALVYLGSGTWSEPRNSAPAANAPVDEQRDGQDGRGRGPGDG